MSQHSSMARREAAPLQPIFANTEGLRQHLNHSFNEGNMRSLLMRNIKQAKATNPLTFVKKYRGVLSRSKGCRTRDISRLRSMLDEGGSVGDIEAEVVDPLQKLSFGSKDVRY
mmetsp:Transcript_15930/g.24615  ORF Transcript_15930/g.24615 Transcript_15930/m.24615 type:complete len:113 (-) Transcript_15930:896-1234(-)